MSENIPQEIIKRIVNLIIVDLSDRSGLQNEWEAINIETQQEIHKTWTEIIQTALSPFKQHLTESCGRCGRCRVRAIDFSAE